MSPDGLAVQEALRPTQTLQNSGRPTKLTDEVLRVIETAMQDDETTAREISVRLQQLYISHMSLHTILKGRKLLGWTFRGSAYYQLICAQNKEKRLEWVESYLHDSFEDVVWTDKTTVQLETHHHFCCRKNGRSLVTSLDQNTPSKFMFGLE